MNQIRGNKGAGSEFDQLFPENDCVTTISELSAWTSVYDVAAATRCLLNRPNPDDQFVEMLALPFPGDDQCEQVILKFLYWLVHAYVVPTPKVTLAAMVEPRIDLALAEVLKEIKFRPKIQIRPIDQVRPMEPGIIGGNDYRVLLVKDKAHVIELLHYPLRCLMSCIIPNCQTAANMRELQRLAAETSDNPMQIFHHPYTDSRLSALIEAVCFYTYGLDIGLTYAEFGKFEIDRSYRSVNVRARPPFSLTRSHSREAYTKNCWGHYDDKPSASTLYKRRPNARSNFSGIQP